MNSIPNPPFKICPATKEEAELIDDKLDVFNRSHFQATQGPAVHRLNAVAKVDEVLGGGIIYVVYHQVLYVDVLFVEEDYRHQGLGSQLLRHAEDEAKALGAKLAHLDTFDFQAKDFYLKHAYEIFGVLDGCPQGHQRFYMKKRL